MLFKAAFGAPKADRGTNSNAAAAGGEHFNKQRDDYQKVIELEERLPPAQPKEHRRAPRSEESTRGYNNFSGIARYSSQRKVWAN